MASNLLDSVSVLCYALDNVCNCLHEANGLDEHINLPDMLRFFTEEEIDLLRKQTTEAMGFLGAIHIRIGNRKKAVKQLWCGEYTMHTTNVAEPQE